MPYYTITVFEKKAGARRRRRLAIASANKAHAQVAIHDMCKETGFVPDYTTLDEVNYNQYLKIITTLFGRKIHKTI